MLFEKLRSNYREKKSLAFLLAFTVMISMLTMGAISDIEAKTITLIQKDAFKDIENQREIVTKKVTVEEFLDEQEISLGENDIINVGLNDKLTHEQVITVEKSRMIELHVDGQISFKRTAKKTVGEVLEESGIVLTENDLVTPAIDSVVEENTVIAVTRIEVSEETIENEIPYKTVEEKDASIYVGTSVVKRYGANGLERKTYKVTRSDGAEISRELISEEVVREPVDEILRVGAKQNSAVVEKKTSIATANSEFKNSADTLYKNGKGFSYKRVIEVTATAYDPSPSSNAGYSKTAYGLTPEYGVVAVDPKVIPLGTRLYIESADGGASWTYGYCIAGDTGGAIKGNKVDLCYNTKAECIQFGKRSATVYILD